MSSSASNPAQTESPRRELSARQLETVVRLTEATHEELREHGYDHLSVRGAAARADVAPATAYTYFSSKNHLVAETFWRHLMARPRPAPADGTPRERVIAAVSYMTDFLIEEPELAAAATTALLGPHPDVEALRIRIGRLYVERLREAVGPDAGTGLLDTLTMAFFGGMLQAGMGFMSYERMSERLVDAVTVIMEGGR